MRTALAQAAAGGEAFLYRFDWSPPAAGSALGAAHGFDEAFVWNAVDGARFPLAAGDPEATRLAMEMSGALIAFARTGSPGWANLSRRREMRVFGAAPAIAAAVDAALLEAWRGAGPPAGARNRAGYGFRASFPAVAKHRQIIDCLLRGLEALEARQSRGAPPEPAIPSGPRLTWIFT